VRIVLARELPRERSTLLVRLMAAGPLLPQALADLAALPRDAHERAVAEQILLNLQSALGQKPSRTPDEQEFIVNMYSTWTDARNMGLDEGRTEARAGDVLTVLRVRGIAVPEVTREQILSQKDAARLERWLERAVVAHSLAEVIDDPS